MNQNEWYEIDSVETLDSPALVIYPARVKQNIALLKIRIDDITRLRPHAKTFKCLEVAKLLIEAGINKFKCATIAEAEMLAMAGAQDVLLAYQPTLEKINRLGQLMFHYSETKFSCLVDNNGSAEEISEAAVFNETTMDVFIDLNVGQNRTGIIPEKALALYTYCDTLPGIIPVGLHAYDGHLTDPDFKVRTEKCNAAFAPVWALQYELIERGHPKPVIIAGGSPTFPIHAKRKEIECSPGTFIYWDRGYETILAEQPFLTAALILGRVISMPDDTKICIDIGHKAVSAENDISKRIYFLNAPNLVMVSQSEEHLVAEAGYGHNYEIGDEVYGLPHHICPTIALYERAVTIENNAIAGEWRNIARDRKITI